MKTNTLKAKLLNCFFAFTLVFGLCIPSIGSYAYAEPRAETAQEGLAADQASNMKDSVDVAATEDGVSSDTIEGSPADDILTDNVITDAQSLIQGQDQAQEPQEEQEAQAFVADADGFTDFAGLSVKGGTPGVDYALESVTYNSIPRGNDEGYQRQNAREITRESERAKGSFQSLVIKNDCSITIKNTESGECSTSIVVNPGVKVDIIFDGVSISNNFPFNIITNSHINSYDTTEVNHEDVVNKTTVHLTLADNSTNILRAHYVDQANEAMEYQFPGLRCGEGSVLTIDDAILNVDTSGNAIVPDQGKIPNGIAYIDKNHETKISNSNDSSSSLSNLDSKNPGSLYVYGGDRSAAIGGGPLENSGHMTFNGGNVFAYAEGYTSGGAGAGIGGGHAAGSTLSTFNGGVYDVKSSFHGAAIGGGCTYDGGMSTSVLTYPQRDALLSRAARYTRAGDITINGGFVKATGGNHGNAFGQGCMSDNNGGTILITGGTLLPKSYDSDWANYDIGGNGGYVIIEGGSVQCEIRGGSRRFQGNNVANPPKFPSGLSAGQAYGDKAKTYAVELVEVDVKSKIDSMVKAYNNEHPDNQISADYNAQIESWDFKINKMPYEYGAPARLDDGKLYLWLPQGTFGKEQIDASFSYFVGDTLLTSNTMVPSGATEAISKEYEDFPLDADFVAKNWSKYYDGESIPSIDVDETPIPVNNPVGGRLNDQKYITYNYQKVDNSGSGVSEAITSQSTPAEAGRYYIEVRSTQYGWSGSGKPAAGSFAATYWGHRATGEAKISPVMSKTSFEVMKPIEIEVNGTKKSYTSPTWIQDKADESTDYNTATNNHLIVPVDLTSWKLPFGDAYEDGSDMSRSSCLAPTGRLQLYIDGIAVPARLGGTKEISYTRAADNTNPQPTSGDTTYWVEKDSEGREHTVAYFDLTRSQLEAFGLADKSDADNKHEVYVAYTSADDSAAPRDPETSEASAQAQDESTKDFIPAHNDSAYVNYYESQSEATPVEIELATPDFTLYNEAGTGFVPGDTSEANANKLVLSESTPDGKPVSATAIMNPTGTDQDPGFRTDVSEYRDVLDGSGTVTTHHDDWFPLYIKTNSIGNITWTSSNPSVISIEPVDKTTDRDYVFNKTDYGIGAKAIVKSAGKTTLSATINGTGAYSGATQSFDVYMFPDLAKKPILSASMIARDDSRTDGTIRPGDKLVYTTTATNTTPDSALINPVYSIQIPSATTLDSVVVYDPTGAVVENPTYSFENGKLTFSNLSTLFGEESYKFVIRTTATPEVLKTQENNLVCTASVDGRYGIDPDKFAWDNRIPDEGYEAKQATAEANPTLPDPNPKPEPEPKPSAEEVLGGGIEPSNPNTSEDPDNPTPDPSLPGVLVVNPDPKDPDNPTDPTDPLDPSTPFGKAVEADPTDPTKPSDPDSPKQEPINPGDRIIKFGDKDDPTTPDDIQKELDDQIEKKLEEDPEATEVEIPVKVWTPDPTDPTNPDKGDTKDVIITVPIPESYKTPDAPDPTERDDHDLVVIPEDVDPREDGDIKTTKTMQNITEGFDKRANKNIALVGDTIRYTITIENTKVGSAWYKAIVKDPLPKGLEYIPGTTVITLPNDQVVTNFETDYANDAPTLGFCLGDIYGGDKASVSFDVRVVKGSQSDDPQANIAFAYGTEPSDTLTPNPTDPTDPDNPTDPTRPVQQEIPDTPVGPYNPQDEDKTWDDIEKEIIKDIDELFPPKDDAPSTIPGTDPTPTTIEKIISANPLSKDLRITLSAKNETRSDGYTYVGDEVTYTIDIENLGDADTMFYDVIARADIPKGLTFIPGSIYLTTVEGNTIQVSDSAYSDATRILSLCAGNIPGQKIAKVVFKAEVVLEAINADIGMTSYVYATLPEDLPRDYEALEAGAAFVPVEGWEAYASEHVVVSNQDKVYPSEKVTAQDHVLGTPEQIAEADKLAKTSDFIGFAAAGIGVIAIIAAVALIISRKRMKRNEK